MILEQTSSSRPVLSDCHCTSEAPLTIPHVDSWWMNLSGLDPSNARWQMTLPSDGTSIYSFCSQKAPSDWPGGTNTSIIYHYYGGISGRYRLFFRL